MTRKLTSGDASFRNILLIVVIPGLICCSLPANSQEVSDQGEQAADSGNLTNSTAPDSSFNPIPILRRMDRDQDGVLHPSEVPAGADEFYREILKAADLDKDVPVTLVVLEFCWEKRDINRESKSRSSQARPETAVRNAYNLVQSFDRDDDHTLQASEWKQFAEHWGTIDSDQNTQITVAEMALHLHQESLARYTTAQSEHFESLPESTIAHIEKLAEEIILNAAEEHKDADKDKVKHREKMSGPERTRLYASELLRIYDANDDEMLDRTEAGALGKDWINIDINRDEMLSLDEMEVRLNTLMKDRQSGQEQQSEKQESDKPSKAKRTGILLDLPERFFELDASGDRQIQMHEFALEWTDEKLAEFSRYDKNEDGLITPREWLQGEIQHRRTTQQTASEE